MEKGITHVDDPAGDAGLADCVVFEPEDLAAFQDEPAAAPAQGGGSRDTLA